MATYSNSNVHVCMSISALLQVLQCVATLAVQHSGQHLTHAMYMVR